MAFEYDIDGESFEFDKEPSQAEWPAIIEAIKARKGQQPPKKRETTWVEDLKIPTASALDAIQTGGHMAAHGAVGAVRDLIGKPISPEESDAYFNRMNENSRGLEQWANPEQAQQGFGAKLGGTIATLPLQIAAMPGQSAVRGKTMIDNGESVDAAITGTLADTALNTLAIGLPASLGTKALTKMGTGAAANVATGMASDAVTQAVSTQESTKKQYDPYNWENRAMEALIGAGVGVAAKGKAAKVADAKDPPAVEKRLDDILAQREAAKNPPEALGAAVDEVGIRNPYDTAGHVTGRVEQPRPDALGREQPLPNLMPELEAQRQNLPPRMDEVTPRVESETPLPVIEAPRIGAEPTPKTEKTPFPRVNVDPELWTPREFRRYDVGDTGMSVEWKSSSDPVTKTQEARVTVRDAQGRRLAEAIAIPHPEGLEVKIVRNFTGDEGSVLPRTKGLGKIIYGVLSEAGDVIPSKNQTEAGAAMMSRFSQAGVMKEGKIPFQSLQRRQFTKLGIKPHVTTKLQKTVSDSIKCAK